MGSAFANKGFGMYLQLILYVVCECFRFNGNGNPADYETSYIILDTANKGFGTYLQFIYAFLSNCKNNRKICTSIF